MACAAAVAVALLALLSPALRVSATSSDWLEAAPAGLGGALPGRFIVVFAPEAGPADAAAGELVRQVSAALAAEAGAAAQQPRCDEGACWVGAVEAAGAAPGVRLLRSLGGAPAASGARGAAAAGGGRAAAAPPPLQAALLEASPAALAHVRRSRLVKAVVPDRAVAAQAGPRCVAGGAAALARGVPGTPAPGLAWPHCLTPTARLLWVGAPCGGANSSSSAVAYRELRAVDAASGRPLTGGGGLPCVLRPDTARPQWTRARFGGCGAPPLLVRDLPARLCAPPRAPAPAPGQQPAALPRAPLAPGDAVPAGVAAVEAASAARGVVDVDAAPRAGPGGGRLSVAVVDSGVDGTHPDLSLVGGASWVEAAPGVPGDAAAHDTDAYGHGTHVAGIVAARNNGAGLVGVLPGAPVVSLKVLDGAGRGALSSLLAAVQWASGPAGEVAGVGVINLSLASFADPASADWPDTLAAVCGVFAEASDAGIVVVTSAGNYGASLAGYLPASCPTVGVATALDAGGAPAGFSNWLPAAAPPAERARVLAVPGVAVNSTLPRGAAASGYGVLSGTSMASPHVAGAAASCVLSGACPRAASGAAKLAALVAASAARAARAPAYGPPPATSAASGRHYGGLVWAGF
ncbi:aprE [Scenedesmus sp. PABB004]|nr:aprE [Scenedesmus sp. PABB004]